MTTRDRFNAILARQREIAKESKAAGTGVGDEYVALTSELSALRLTLAHEVRSEKARIAVLREAEVVLAASNRSANALDARVEAPAASADTN